MNLGRKSTMDSVANQEMFLWFAIPLASNFCSMMEFALEQVIERQIAGIWLKSSCREVFCLQNISNRTHSTFYDF